MSRFSCIDNTTKRLFLIHLLTLMYNISNMGLYIESPNEFGEHYGLINHHLSEFNKDNTGQIILFSTIIFFTVILGYSNQKSYAYHINKALSKNDHSEDAESHPLIYQHEPESQPSKFDLVTSLLSGLYKATVASSSLAALLKNTLGSGSAIGASVLCGPGNFMAQFAVFAAPLAKKYHWHISYKRRWLLAHFLTLCYNIPNVALYFNAGDEFLQHIGVLKHRLIDHQENWDYILLALLAVGSVFLFLSTQRSYAQKVANIFTDTEQELDSYNAQTEYGCCVSILDKLHCFFVVESRVTAVYKAAINYISLVAALYSFSQQLVVSFVLASLCMPGNLYAQFSILKPEQSRLQKENEQLEPVQWQRYGCGLFSRRTVLQPIGLGPLKQDHFGNLI